MRASTKTFIRQANRDMYHSMVGFHVGMFKGLGLTLGVVAGLKATGLIPGINTALVKKFKK